MRENVAADYAKLEKSQKLPSISVFNWSNSHIKVKSHSEFKPLIVIAYEGVKTQSEYNVYFVNLKEFLNDFKDSPPSLG